MRFTEDDDDDDDANSLSQEGREMNGSVYKQQLHGAASFLRS